MIAGLTGSNVMHNSSVTQRTGSFRNGHATPLNEERHELLCSSVTLRPAVERSVWRVAALGVSGAYKREVLSCIV